jgi:hypothetical protein
MALLGGLCKAHLSCHISPRKGKTELGALVLSRGLVAQLPAHFRLLGRTEMALGLRIGLGIAFVFLAHQGLTQIRTALDFTLFSLCGRLPWNCASP